MTKPLNLSWTLRDAHPGDGPAIGALESAHPDSGAFGLSFHYRVDAFAAQNALRPGTLGIVAEGNGAVVGMGFVTIGRGRLGAESRTVGTIFGLVIHAQWRRLGIATALYQALVDRVRSLDPKAVVTAGVQADNEGSQRSARKWAEQAILGRTRVVLGPPPKRRPRISSGLHLRLVAATDWPGVARGMNLCFGDHQLAPEFDATELEARYSAQPFGEPLRGYLVATDAQDHLVAGIGVVFDASIQSGRFDHIPLPIRLLNLILNLLPRDGVLRRLVIRDAWYDTDHPQGPAAIRDLWNHAGWQWKDRGNSLMGFVDSQGPLAKALPRTPGVPDGGGWLMVSSVPALDLSKPLWLPM